MNLACCVSIVLLLYFSHTVCTEQAEKCGLMDFDSSPEDLQILQPRTYYVYTSFPVPPCANVTFNYINFCYSFMASKIPKTLNVGKLYILDNRTKSVVQKRVTLWGDNASCKGNIFKKASYTVCCVSQLLDYYDFNIQRGTINKYFALRIPQRKRSISIGYKSDQHEAIGFKKKFKKDRTPTNNTDEDLNSDEDDANDNTFVLSGVHYNLTLPLVSFTVEAMPHYPSHIPTTPSHITPTPTPLVTEDSEHLLTSSQSIVLWNERQEELNTNSTPGDSSSNLCDTTNCTCNDGRNEKPNAAVYTAASFYALVGLSSFLLALSVLLGILVTLLCWSKKSKGGARSLGARHYFGEELVPSNSWTFLTRKSEANNARKYNQSEETKEGASLRMTKEGAHLSGTTITDEEEDDAYVEINPARHNVNKEAQWNGKDHIVSNSPVLPPTSVVQHNTANKHGKYPLTHTNLEESFYMSMKSPVTQDSLDDQTNSSLTKVSARRKKIRPSLDLMKQENTESSRLFPKKK